MKELSGRELAGYIKARQAKQVRSLRQARGIFPRLAIIKTKQDQAINTYVRMKQKYGKDILVDVDVYDIDQADVVATIKRLNADPLVKGIIVQLPLANPAQTDEIVDLVDPGKDVDALGAKAKLQPATPQAILWLLAGYNVELAGKQIAVVGRGRLVGAPLIRMLKESGLSPLDIGNDTEDLKAALAPMDIIISATGSPRLIKPSMVKRGAVVIDAGTASEDGVVVGDLDPDIYKREDLAITPQKGGVGPLTICALFENLLQASAKQG